MRQKERSVEGVSVSVPKGHQSNQGEPPRQETDPEKASRKERRTHDPKQNKDTQGIPGK